MVVVGAVGVEEEAIPCRCRAAATKGGDRTGCVLVVLVVVVVANDEEVVVAAEERVVVVGDASLLLRVCCNI